MTRAAGLLVGVAFGVGLIVLLVFTVDLGQVLAALRNAHYGWVLLSLILSVIGLWARAVRWRVFLDGKLSFWHTFHISNIGYMLNALLPFRAGEIARVVLAANAHPPVAMMTTLSSILLERIIDLLFLFALLGLSLTVLPMPDFVAAGGATLAIAAVLGGVLLFIAAVHRVWALRLLYIVLRFAPFLERFAPEERLHRFLDGLSVLTSSSRFAGLFAWSLVAWACTVASGYVMLHAFFGAASLAVALLFIVTSSLFSAAAGALSTIPAGIGSVQAGIILALTVSGYTQPQGAPLALAIVLHATQLCLYTAFGVIGLTRQHIDLRELLARVRRRQRQTIPAS